MQTVGIVGVGLIGGSFGLALKHTGFRGTILGVSSERSIEEGLARGAIDRGSSLAEAAGQADLLFLAQPVSGIIETLNKLDPLVRTDALVTDAGSTKRAVVDQARVSLKRCAFLGGHPIAGKEQRGARAADPELFRNHTWVLTPAAPEDLQHPVAREFCRCLQRMGARQLLLDAAQHDRLLAWSSHLPQLISTALAAVLHDEMPEAASVAGRGLLDSTRLALSSYEVWNDILATNAEPISLAMDAYIEKLKTMRSQLSTEFEKASEFAKKLRSRS